MKKSKKISLWIVGCLVCIGSLGTSTYLSLTTQDESIEQIELYCNVNKPEQIIHACLEKIRQLAPPFSDNRIGRVYSWTILANSSEEAAALTNSILTIAKEAGFERGSSGKMRENDSIQMIITKSKESSPAIVSVLFINLIEGEK